MSSIERFPFRSLDRVMAVARCIADMMIQLELEFSDALDAERLAKAIDLSLDAEPVLGCRFVRHWRKPYWEKLDEGARAAFLFTDEQDVYEAFKHRPMDVHSGSQLKACLWHSSAGDRLLLKVTHEASDTYGLKEAAALVSGVYSRLADEPDFRPEINLRGSRSLWQVMRRVPWYSYPRIYLNFLRETWHSYIYVPKATHTLPLKDEPRTKLAFVSRSLPEDNAAPLIQYGRERGATINDLVLAAFFRALASVGNWDGRSQLRVMTSVDLRRYLPTGRGGAVANLSAPEGLSLGTDLGDDFSSTLEKVTALTRRRKASWIGLSDCVGTVPMVRYLPYDWVMKGAPKVVRKTIRAHRFAPILTNMGSIDPKTVTFGSPPLQARFLPPLYHPPAFFAALGGYAGTLTLSAGVYRTQKEIIERFFDAVVAELPLS